MNKILNINNHALTEAQITDLKLTYNDFEVINLGTELKSMWSSISPWFNQPDIKKYITPKLIKLVTETQPIAIILAGELSCCFDFALTILRGIDTYSIDVLVATSERKSEDTYNELTGETVKTNVFRHCKFRKLLV